MTPPKDQTTQPTDSELLDRYRESGQTEWLGRLYLRYTERIYGMALRYLGNRPDAEDAVMQLFEELCDKAHRYEIREFRTWLHSVVRNHCLGMLRRAGKMPSTPLPGDLCDDREFVTMLADAEARDLRTEALSRCMERLPEPQRQSIELFFFEERSYAEIAEATSWHLKSVKSYIQNGKRNLRLCLENYLQ